MRAKEQIQKALRTIMNASEANACEVYKAHDYGDHISAYGWWYKPFGETAHYLGDNLTDALEEIEAIADYQ